MEYERLPERKDSMTDEKDPLPSAHDPVTFVGDTEERSRPRWHPLNVEQAQTAAAAEPVKVKVKAPFRVVHEATPHTGGDVVEVPRQIAAAWIAKNWAEPVPPES